VTHTPGLWSICDERDSNATRLRMPLSCVLVDLLSCVCSQVPLGCCSLALHPFQRHAVLPMASQSVLCAELALVLAPIFCFC
jgi:hypothetical protein